MRDLPPHGNWDRSANRSLLANEVGFDATVFSLAFLGLVIGHRLGRTITFSLETLGSNPESLDEITADAVGTALGEFHVARLVADTVGMSFDNPPGFGEFRQEIGQFFQLVMVLGFDVRLVGVELDVDDRWAAQLCSGFRHDYRRWNLDGHVGRTCCNASCTFTGQGIGGGVCRGYALAALWLNSTDERLNGAFRGILRCPV